MSETVEYRAWQQMKQRCLNGRHAQYEDYGGRGITICPEWLKSFHNFYRDMGQRPSERHSLDRIENNGNYDPANCRWATSEQQNRNRRNLPAHGHGRRRNGQRRKGVAW